MLRKIPMSLAVCGFVLGLTAVSFAMHCHGRQDDHMQLAQAEMGTMQMNNETVTGETTKKAEDVGNKICPVTGEKIDEKTKATYEYQGKIYNFCCPVCIDEFKKDPEKYIKKIEEEKQKEAAGTASEKSETETETAEHHHEHGK